MSEDQLLNALGRTARDDEAAAGLDERWDRLAAGTASAGEVAELEALAASSPEAREIYEAFRPLGAAFEARVVAAAQAELPRPSARLLPFRHAGLRRWAPWAALGAAAAALLLLVRPLPQAPLPDYALQLSAGDQTERGDEPTNGALPVFTPGSLLTLRLEPHEVPEGEVEVRCCWFLLDAEGIGDTAAVRWQATVEAGRAGIVRVRGTVGEDFALSPGLWTMWAAIGRSGEMPREAEVVAALRGGLAEAKCWRPVAQRLRVEAPVEP